MNAKPTILDPWELAKIAPKPGYARLTRDEIAAQVRYLFREWYGKTKAEGPNAGMCLHWTHCACCVLRLCGYRAILQAGSMNWPINVNAPPPAATHFSYEWQPEHPASVFNILQGGMPEYHCWVAIPERQEIADFATGYFKEVAIERHGLTWVDADPPSYLWCNANALPEGVRYRPSLPAIRFVLEFLTREPIPTD